MIRLFVFGTLKRGFPLHSSLAGCDFLGPYRTVMPFPMLVAGPRYAPMMLDEPGSGYRVKGDLYAIVPSNLAALDRMEIRWAARPLP